MATFFASGFVMMNLPIVSPLKYPLGVTWNMYSGGVPAPPDPIDPVILGLADTPLQIIPSCTKVGLAAIATPLHGLTVIMKTFSSCTIFFAAAMPFASAHAVSPKTISNFRPYTPPRSLT